MDGDVWLAVQDKKSHQHKFPNNGKAMNSWLVGMVKCSHCGYALHFNHSTAGKNNKIYYRFIDYGKYTVNGCDTGLIKIRPKTVEEIVLQAMRDRISELSIAKKTAEKPNPETESIKADIIRTDEEINKLMSRLADADDVLFDYIQDRVSKLHEQRTELEKQLHTKARKRKAIDTKPLEEPMSRWDSLTIQEKHELASMMIEVVRVADDTGVEVIFSI